MEWLSQHLQQWGLVWFGLLFWGSIFGAVLMYVFDANFLMSLVGYLLGLAFKKKKKNKGWSWIS